MMANINLYISIAKSTPTNLKRRFILEHFFMFIDFSPNFHVLFYVDK